MRGREGLDKAPFSPTVESTRQHIDEWEQGQHEKLSRKVQKAREELHRAEQSVRVRRSR